MHLGAPTLSLNCPSKAEDGPSSTSTDKDHKTCSVNTKKLAQQHHRSLRCLDRECRNFSKALQSGIGTFHSKVNVTIKSVWKPAFKWKTNVSIFKTTTKKEQLIKIISAHLCVKQLWMCSWPGCLIRSPSETSEMLLWAKGQEASCRGCASSLRSSDDTHLSSLGKRTCESVGARGI